MINGSDKYGSIPEFFFLNINYLLYYFFVKSFQFLLYCVLTNH